MPMGSKGIIQHYLVVMSFSLMICSYKGNGQSTTGCTSVLIGLAPCLNYVRGNSSTPSSSCCSQLTSVVQSQPRCLCALVNGGGSSLGITINQTLALSLPAACNVQTPPVSLCNGGNNGPAPASSPMTPPSDDSDADTPNSAPNVPILPGGGSKAVPTAGGGSKTVPTAGGGSKTVPTAGATSAAPITKMQLHLTLFIIFFASNFF